MDEQKFEKKLKDVKWFSVIILVLALIGFFVNLSSGALVGINLILGIILIVLLFGTIIGCNNKKMYGPGCGIIVAILMVISPTFFGAILGVFYLVECIILINHMRIK